MNSPETEPDPAPRRWRFRFSLRTLLIVMPILAALLGWIGNSVQRQNREKSAAMSLQTKLHPVSWNSYAGRWQLVLASSSKRGRRLQMHVPYTSLSIGDNSQVFEFDDVDWELIDRLPDLESVHFTGYHGPATGETFSHFDDLQRLSLFGCQLSQSDLEQINRLAELTSLEIYPERPKPQAPGAPQRPMLKIEPRSWPQLESLTIIRFDLPATSLAAILGMPRLDRLSIANCRLDTQTLRQAEADSQLTSMTYSPLSAHRDDMEATAQINAATQELVCYLGRLPKLETVEITFAKFDDFGRGAGELRRRWPAVRQLRLKFCDISAQAIREIAAMPNLAELTLYSCTVPPEAYQALDAAANLVALNIAGTDLEEGEIVRLPRSPKLQSLVLGGDAIGDEAMQDVAQLSQLTHLSLYQTYVGDRGIALLENHPTLASFAYEEGPMTNRSLASLVKIKNISLAECRLRSSGIRPIVLEELQTLAREGGDVEARLKERHLTPAKPLP